MTHDEAGSAETKIPIQSLNPKGSTIRNIAARLGVIAATLAATMSIAPSAMAAPAADKELCKSGGYASYIDPTTDLPFKNQGRCVSFVNGGGVLVPVEEPPVVEPPTVKLGTLQFGFVYEPVPNAFSYALRLTGFQPNTTFDLVVFSPEDGVGGPGYLGSWAPTTDASGEAVIGLDDSGWMGLIAGSCNPINGPLTATAYPVVDGVVDTDSSVTIAAPEAFCDGDGTLVREWLTV